MFLVVRAECDYRLLIRNDPLQITIHIDQVRHYSSFNFKLPDASMAPKDFYQAKHGDGYDPKIKKKPVAIPPEIKAVFLTSEYLHPFLIQEVILAPPMFPW